MPTIINVVTVFVYYYTIIAFSKSDPEDAAFLRLSNYLALSSKNYLSPDIRFVVNITIYKEFLFVELRASAWYPSYLLYFNKIRWML